MARKTFRQVKKRSSLKNRRGAIGKKSKVQRRSGSRRRIKMISGGAAWLYNQTSLSIIWNSLFMERVKKQYADFLPRINPLDINADSSIKVLFVIDMQKDFVDRNYTRTNGDKHPVFQSEIAGGNFAVTDAIKMLGGSATDEEAVTNFTDDETAKQIIEKSEFLKHIRDALMPESKYKYVIFSRDYHPKGHCSFNNRWFNEATLCEDCNNGGNFPAHCVQGFEGSKFIPEIEYLINNAGNNTKVKVVFKGVDKECDSFTAVQKISVDHNASNVNPNIERSNCSSVTGAFLLKDTTKNLTNESFDKSAATFVSYQDGDINLTDATHIEVCGLAGDYCVRDTVVALADKFKDKKIVLLNDFTRYPTLPFVTIGLLPQHNYKAASKSILPILSDYDKTLGPDMTGPDPVTEYSEIQEYFENEFNPVDTFTFRKDRATPFLNYALTPLKTETQYKDIIYYLLKKENNVLKLLSSEQIEQIKNNVDNVDNVDNNVETLNEVLGNPNAESPDFRFTNYEHFITPFQAIIDDYKTRPNIFVSMKNFIDKLY